ASYLWIDCNTGNPVPGETAQSITPAATGDYRVVVTLKGCQDTSACYHVEVEEEMGINGLTGNITGISLYPNPATNRISLTSSTPVQRVRIFNIMGATMLEYHAGGKKEVSLELNGFSTGIYTVQIETGNGPV